MLYGLSHLPHPEFDIIKKIILLYPNHVQNLTIAGVITVLFIQFHWQLETVNSCFWFANLLFWKFDTSPKKEIKMIKTQILWWKITKQTNKQKNKQKRQKSIWKHWVTFLLWTRSTDPWCNMLWILEKRKKYIGFILSGEHTLLTFLF